VAAADDDDVVAIRAHQGMKLHRFRRKCGQGIGADIG